jgi:hypothetical protein
MHSEAICFECFVHTESLQPDKKLKLAEEKNLERRVHMSEEEILCEEFNFNYIVRIFSSLVCPLNHLCKKKIHVQVFRGNVGTRSVWWVHRRCEDIVKMEPRGVGFEGCSRLELT